MKNNQGGTDNHVSEVQEDFAIFLHFEAIGSDPRWKIGNYDEKGILSPNEKTILAEQFDLPRNLVDELSIYIGNCLDRESEVNLTRVTRSKALLRGAKSLEQMAKLARRMSRDRADCEAIGHSLSAHFAETKEAGLLLDEIRGDLAQVTYVLNNLERKLEQLIGAPGGAAELVPDDKRKSVDMRRQHVVRSCCYIWVDAGNKVSYTTKSHDPDEPQRSGPLVAFIQTVIGFVTSPTTEVSVETIRRDIDTFKKLQQAQDTLSTPPQRG